MSQSKPEIELPVYARKPQRKIPGSGGCIAVLVHSLGKSRHGGIREYVLFSPAGERIGAVSWHSKRLALSAGYHEGHVAFHRSLRTWGSLAEAAAVMMAEQEAK